MMEQQKVFPTACFGFDKKVVLDYIYEQDTAAKAREAEQEEHAAKLEAQVAELQGTIEELNAQCELMQSQLYGERETTAAIRASYEKLKSDADQLVQVARNKDKELQIQLELNKQLQGRNSELESRLAAAREEQQEEEESPTPQELLEEAEARAAAILEKARKEAAGIREAAAAREADHTAEIARLQDELSQIKESVGKTLSQLEGEISKLHGDKGAQEESRFFPPVSGQQEAGRVKVKKVRR
jgi:chromosome segregation ATPase